MEPINLRIFILSPLSEGFSDENSGRRRTVKDDNYHLNLTSMILDVNIHTYIFSCSDCRINKRLAADVLSGNLSPLNMVPVLNETK